MVLTQREHRLPPSTSCCQTLPSSAEETEKQVKLALRTSLNSSRLVFSSNPLSTDPTDATHLAELAKVQAILFRDGQSVGKLTNARVTLSPVVPQPIASQRVEAVGLHYHEWQPVEPVSKTIQQQQALAIPVDDSFHASCFEAKVFGPTCSDFTFSGAAAGACVSQHRQRLEYIRSQRLRHSSNAPVEPALDDVLHKHEFSCGEGLQHCTLSFEANERQAWLTGLQFHLAYLVSAVSGDVNGASADAALPATNRQQGERTAAQAAEARGSGEGAVTPMASHSAVPEAASARQQPLQPLSRKHSSKRSKKRSGFKPEADMGEQQRLEHAGSGMLSADVLSQQSAGTRIIARISSSSDGSMSSSSSSCQTCHSSPSHLLQNGNGIWKHGAGTGHSSSCNSSSSGSRRPSSGSVGSSDDSSGISSGVSSGSGQQLHSARGSSSSGGGGGSSSSGGAGSSGEGGDGRRPPRGGGNAPRGSRDDMQEQQERQRQQERLQRLHQEHQDQPHAQDKQRHQHDDDADSEGQGAHGSSGGRGPSSERLANGHAHALAGGHHHGGAVSKAGGHYQNGRTLHAEAPVAVQREQAADSKPEARQTWHRSEPVQPPSSGDTSSQRGRTEAAAANNGPAGHVAGKKPVGTNGYHHHHHAPQLQQLHALLQQPLLQPQQQQQRGGSPSPVRHKNGKTPYASPAATASNRNGSCPLTPELLAAYNLSFGALNGALEPSAAFIRQRVAEATPEVLLEALPSPLLQRGVAPGRGARWAAFQPATRAVARSEGQRSPSPHRLEEGPAGGRGAAAGRDARGGRGGSSGRGGVRLSREAMMDRLDSMSDPGSGAKRQRARAGARAPRTGAVGTVGGLGAANAAAAGPAGAANARGGARHGEWLEAGPVMRSPQQPGPSAKQQHASFEAAAAMVQAQQQQQVALLQQMAAAGLPLPRHGSFGSSRGAHAPHVNGAVAAPPVLQPHHVQLSPVRHRSAAAVASHAQQQQQQQRYPPSPLPHAGRLSPAFAPPVALRHGAAAADMAAVAASGGCSSDLERFLRQITPTIPLPPGEPLHQSLARLTLADVWRFYAEPSLVGKEVLTLGGARGPSKSYFVPYLSAMQLFVPAGETGSSSNGSSSARGPLYVLEEPVEGWPRRMRLLCEHVEQELPFNRDAMAAQLECLANGSGPGAALHSTRLLDLHPASWFAVAWYPVYRIPDAPLTTRFLTFHGLAEVQALAAEVQGSTTRALEPAGPRAVALNVVGLQWYNMQGEPWLEPSGGGSGRSAGGLEEVLWQARVAELQDTAERLARAKGLRMLKGGAQHEVYLRVPDYEFFQLRN